MLDLLLRRFTKDRFTPKVHESRKDELPSVFVAYFLGNRLSHFLFSMGFVLLAIVLPKFIVIVVF